MVYIISTLLRKAFEKHTHIFEENEPEDLWKYLMLIPKDYSHKAIFNETTRNIMKKIEFEHGGQEYDDLYPKGIPTSLSITTKSGQEYDSGLI